MPRGDAFRDRLRCMLADRRSVEARGMLEYIMGCAHRRVTQVSRANRGLLTESECEEVVGEVMLGLLRTGFSSFRGESMPELLAFVRIISERTAWRRLKRKRKESDILDAGGEEASFCAVLPAPDSSAERFAESPLSEVDQSYLTALLRAGSKAELARQSGVSRAAVTQRVQRIVERVTAMPAQQRATHDVWMRQEAARALDDIG